MSKINRRKLLPYLLNEIGVVMGEFQGVKSFQLGEIDQLPDEALLQMIPARDPGCQIFIADGFVCSGERSGEALQLFPTEQANLDIFNAFNGRQTLRQVVEQIMDKQACSFEEAFPPVKVMFLQLLKLRVILPKNPLET